MQYSRLNRQWRFYIPLLMLLVTSLFISNHSYAQESVAQIVSMTGQVEFRSAGTSAWQPARVNQLLFAQDAIRTGANGRLALLMSDETQMQINRNSEMQLNEVAESSGWQRLKGFVRTSIGSNRSQLSLESGEIWMRNKNRDINIDINTNVVSAGIRGTEINMRINEDQTVNIAVMEGTIEASNAFGTMIASGGEEVITAAGSAPRKVILVQAQDTVQWTLQVPRLFGPTSFPLESADRGALETQRQGLQTATSPTDRIQLARVLRDLGESNEAQDGLPVNLIYRAK